MTSFLKWTALINLVPIQNLNIFLEDQKIFHFYHNTSFPKPIRTIFTTKTPKINNPCKNPATQTQRKSRKSSDHGTVVLENGQTFRQKARQLTLLLVPLLARCTKTCSGIEPWGERTLEVKSQFAANGLQVVGSRFELGWDRRIKSDE